MLDVVRRICCGLAIVLVLSAVASAQSTKPVATWALTVKQLADALGGKDAATLSALVQAGPIIRTFDSDMLLNSDKLLGATSGVTVLGEHAYLKPPTTLASDLAANFQSAADVPEQIRDRMIPPDESTAKKANETAAQWLMQTLQPAKDQHVGVIVLWPNERNASYAIRKRPIFVLVKGQLIDGQYVLRQIMFGDPLGG
jgi:hypothetical protein